MNKLAILTLTVIPLSSSFSQRQSEGPNLLHHDPASVAFVSPALENYIDGSINNDLWKRPQLSPRDRSVITLAVIISRNQNSLLAGELNRALDNGVKPAEISEILTHLAFYSGLDNATSASDIIREVFSARGIGTEAMPAANPVLLPLDEKNEEKRVATASEIAGAVSPGLVKYTTDVLFRSLWLRPGLSPRDRSLVTMTSLIANGQVGQIGFHLNKAMDNGLTREQVGESLAQIAFYAGWPNAFSAVPIIKEVFNHRES
ncbi:carboxymuconolactone decarboxylase family protein [Klebsiella pneumoniae]|nr:carboxymuconolactone decarboxylase family protein [Klebsiella pneumoniae]